MEITIKTHSDSEGGSGTKLVMSNRQDGYVRLAATDKNGKTRYLEVKSTEFFPGVKALEAEAKASDR